MYLTLRFGRPDPACGFARFSIGRCDLRPLNRGRRRCRERRGNAVQADPMKPTLKPPGTKRLKLKHDEWLSNVAFSFILRRYDEVVLCWTPFVDPESAILAGPCTRPLFGST